MTELLTCYQCGARSAVLDIDGDALRCVEQRIGDRRRSRSHHLLAGTELRRRQGGLRAQVTGMRLWATLTVSSAATVASSAESRSISASLISPALTTCGLASKNEYSPLRLPSPRTYTG